MQSKQTTLTDFQKISYNIKNSTYKAVKALHIIAYGDEGVPRQTRRNLRNFSGFAWDKNASEYADKINDVNQKLDMPDLVAVCNLLDLDYSGANDDVIERICSFLNELNVDDKNDEDDDDDNDADDDKEAYDEDKDVYDDKDGFDDEDDNEYEEETESRPTMALKTKKKTKSGRMTAGKVNDSFALSFKDVEDSIRPFDGKDDYPVRKWITDFEEISELMGWNDLQMLIFAKRSLKGIAKLYIQPEKGINSWKLLKKRLTSEFENKISSAEIHKMLMRRKKKHDESVQEYVLTMREIGSRGNIEDEVIIQYTIEGIQDDPVNKVVLYGANNFRDFKEKIKLYELIRKQTAHKSSITETRRKKWTNNEVRQNGRNNEIRRDYRNNEARGDDRRMSENRIKKEEQCYNCGNRGHRSRDCPDKAKGTKCFKCNQFGHVSSRCNAKEDRPSTSGQVNVIDVVYKN
ncbi:uncharacterized protein [Diabrotica undecimpunctata]|uniref:uncharacterized protein n=1 Tax=Diabrotica undecimpunctata TaxID=50387 RepID=UPI003B632743